MPVSITFEQSELAGLLEYYSGRRAVIAAQLGELDKKIAEIASYTNGVANGTKQPASKSNGLAINIPFDYPNDGTWAQKIAYLIRQLGGTATTGGIVAKLFEVKPDIGLDRSRAVSKVSAILSINSKDGGVFTKVKNDKDEYEFSLSKEKAAVEAAA